MGDEQEDESPTRNAVPSSSAVTLDAPEPTRAALAWYSADFHRHATDSALEAAGRIYLPSLNEERRQYRTIVPPSGAEWLPREKDLFFVALTRHSRLRPDLIACDVPGKSEAEVLWYIDELEWQSLQLRRTDGPVHGFRDRLGRWAAHRRRWIKGFAPAAREVETSWIDEEEKLSAALLRVVERDAAEVRAKRWIKAREAERDEAVDEAFERSGAKYKNRWKVEKSVFASLEERWNIQDWGDPLDDAKLEEIDALLARPPLFPDTSALGIGPSNTAPQNPPDTGLRESSVVLPSRASTPGGLQPADLGLERSGSKLTKIAADRALKAGIMAIPRRDRTPEQRKALSVVLNRERMRIRTRTQKLLAEGWTEARIEAAGGADAVIDKRLEEKEAALPGPGPEASSDNHGSIASPDASPRKRRRRKIKEEDEGEVGELQTETDVEIKKRQWRTRLERFLAEEKLDFFNYTRMAELARLVAQRDNDIPALSWDIIERLRDHLMAYLVPIMYQIITLAEARSAQTLESSAPEDGRRSRSGEPTANPDDQAEEQHRTSDQINVNDVMLALASTGRPHPSEEMRRFWRRQMPRPDVKWPPAADREVEEEEKEEESGDDETRAELDSDSDHVSVDGGSPAESSVQQNASRKPVPSFGMRTNWPKSVLPPGEMPWRLMPCVHSKTVSNASGVRPLSRRSSTSLPRRSRSKAVSRATSVTGSPPPSNFVPSEDETLPSEAETTLTDEEEKKRDELLDRVDSLWDNVLAEDLKAQAAREQLTVDPAASPSRVKPQKGTKRKRSGAAARQGDESLVDYDDPWRGSLQLKRLEAAKSLRSRSRSTSAAGGLDESEDEDEADEEDELCSPLERAKEARDRYTRLLLRISKKRRDRHSRLYQQSRFAALRLRGRAPDSAWYISSEDESDPDADAGVESARDSAKPGRPRRGTEDPFGDAETSEEEVSWAGGSDRESLPDEVVVEEPAVPDDADMQPEYRLSSGSEYAGPEDDS